MARLYALQLADQRAMERQGVRENPIRRSGYAIQGGAAPTEPLEFALASHRAMEEQHSRQNPHRKGATPTMGVSQVRGGSVGDVMWGLVDPFGFHNVGRGGAMTGGMSRAEVKAMREASFASMSPERQAAYNADMERHGIRGVYPKGGAMTGGSVGDVMWGLVDPFGFHNVGRGGAMTGGMTRAEKRAAMTPEQLAVDDRLRQYGKTGRGAMSGGRAVPSSGLSQFRGGSNGVVVGAGHGSDEEMEGGGELTITHGGARDMEIMARESGRRPAIRSGQSDKHSVEAKEMGRHLGRHLMAVRGGGFFDLFTKGIVEAGRQGESVSKFTGLPNSSPPPIPDPNASAGPDATPDAGADAGPPPPPSGGSALFYRQGDMSKDVDEHHEEHTARRFGRTHRGGAYDFSSIMPKKEEPMRDKEYNLRQQMPQFEKKKMGGFLSGSYEGMGEYGGRTKRGKMMRKQKQIEEGNILHTMDDDFPAREGPEATHGNRTSGKKRTMEINKMRGAFGTNTEPSSSEEEESSGSGKLTITHGGARAARAAIVKKVMAEQGCSMPQASKYVKEHGLYKGGTRSKSKPSKKEKNPYGRTHTSELSLGMTKKVRKPAQAPPHEDQPDMGLALDLPPPPKGKGRRAPAGPSDGRRARAAIVKKVMAEKGCSMIEASKYVKEHNLY